MLKQQYQGNVNSMVKVLRKENSIPCYSTMDSRLFPSCLHADILWLISCFSSTARWLHVPDISMCNRTNICIIIVINYYSDDRRTGTQIADTRTTTHWNKASTYTKLRIKK